MFTPSMPQETRAEHAGPLGASGRAGLTDPVSGVIPSPLAARVPGPDAPTKPKKGLIAGAAICERGAFDDRATAVRRHRHEPAAVAACGLAHPGRQRQENEDAFGSFIERGCSSSPTAWAGTTRARSPARWRSTPSRDFFRSFHADPRQVWPYSVDRTLSLAANLLRVGIKVANDKIRAGATADRARARMGATVVAMAVGETQIAIAHAGDSRAYRLRDGELKRLTRDHSIAEEMRAARPEMTDEELANFAHRNVVMRSLGSKDEHRSGRLRQQAAPGRRLPVVHRRAVERGPRPEDRGDPAVDSRHRGGLSAASSTRRTRPAAPTTSRRCWSARARSSD